MASTDVRQHDILDHRVLTEVVTKFPPRDLEGMNLVDTRQVPSNTFEWDEITLSKELASFSGVDSEANVVDPMASTLKLGRTSSIREKKSLKGSTLAWLREPGTRNRQRAMQAVRDELQDLNRRIDKRIEWMIWKSIQGGFSYTDDTYHISVTYDIPSNHKEDPTSLGNGGVLWSDVDNATPVQDLLTMVERVEEDSNITPTRAYMSRKVMRNILQISSVRDLIGEQDLTESIFRTGQIQQMAGLQLIVYDASFTNDEGSTERYVGENNVILTPEPGQHQFVRLFEGPCTDPRSGFQPGRFSKSWQPQDPPTVKVLVDYQSIPVVRLPEAIYVTNVL